jgi:hypothetical protein
VPSEVTVADVGESARWSSAPGVTVSEAVVLAPPIVAVTLCTLAFVAVHVLRVQEPSGPSENVVEPVTSPRSLLSASYPSAVNVCAVPATTVAVAGLRTMWSSAGAWYS